MTLILMIVVVLLLLMLRVPVAFALLIPSVVYVILDSTTSLGVALQQTVSGLNSFTILAVPMFILLGNLANVSGVTDRLYDAAVAFLGHVRGSLGYVNIISSFGFSWVSGAAVADVAAMGRVQVPAMIKRGYSPSFSLGVTGASSLIAPMIPPSIPALIYAVTAGLSVTSLFLVGILPAVLIVFALCAWTWWKFRDRDDAREERSSWSTRTKLFLAALPAAGAAVAVLGGILGGVATPTEASAVGVLYLVVLTLLYRQVDLRTAMRTLTQSLETTASVLLIVAGAALFGWVLARERAPQLAAEALIDLTTNPIVFLLFINLLLFAVGAVLEPVAAILIVVPVLAPVAEIFSIHPLHFATIVILNLTIGLLTPPVGLVLFVLSSVTERPVSEVIRGVLPFYGILVSVLMLITFVPDISLMLPRLFGAA